MGLPGLQIKMPLVFSLTFDSSSDIGGSANPFSILAVTETTLIPQEVAKPL